MLCCIILNRIEGQAEFVQNFVMVSRGSKSWLFRCVPVLFVEIAKFVDPAIALFVDTVKFVDPATFLLVELCRDLR